MKNTFTKNLTTSDIYNDLYIDEELREELLKNSVRIADGDYLIPGSSGETIPINNFQMLSTLVSNGIFVKWLNKIKHQNYMGGTYLYLNHINVNFKNHIKYNLEKQIYEIDQVYEDYPVRGVTWYGAILFCLLVGGRLPTEFEWEICAKGGDSANIYPWGSDPPTNEKANYGNTIGNTTHINQYPSNSFGLYDMAGNLREWCFDKYYPGISYFSNRSSDLDSEYRVVKGGAWDKTESHLKISKRAGKWGRIGTMGIGFRVVFSEGKESFLYC